MDLQPKTERAPTSLYKGMRADIIIPNPANIPASEGLHLAVTGGHDRTDTPKQVLARSLLGLGAAKVVAESGITPEAWANTRVEQGQEVSVYGRVPGVESSWRKPVDTNARVIAEGEGAEKHYDLKQLSALLGRYMPKWEKLAATTELFAGGVEGNDTVDEARRWEIWRSPTHKLNVITDPHLKGLHLVVDPQEHQARQWQTVSEKPDASGEIPEQQYIIATLEATAVALGVQALLAGGAGEIHNSGNWAGGLKSTEEGGKLSLAGLEDDRKREKRKHRPDLAGTDDDFGTSMHVHIYIPENPNDPVVLPEMSKSEAEQRQKDARANGQDETAFAKAIAQWEAIPSTTPEQIATIRKALGEGKLTAWLRENCQGKLIA